jgi:hypothetical protein
MFTKQIPFISVRTVGIFFRDMNEQGRLSCSWMRRGTTDAPKAEGRIRFFLGWILSGLEALVARRRCRKIDSNLDRWSVMRWLDELKRMVKDIMIVLDVATTLLYTEAGNRSIASNHQFDPDEFYPSIWYFVSLSTKLHHLRYIFVFTLMHYRL